MKIFWRIFISFWLAFLVMIGVTAIILSSSSTMRNDKLRDIPLAALQSCATRELDRSRATSPLPASQQEQKCYGGALLPYGVLPSDGSGKRAPLSKEELRVVRAAQNGSGVIALELRTKTYVAFRVADASPANIYLAQIPISSDAFFIFLIKRLARLVLLSGFLGFLLAIYFARPITRLSHAAERFGTGDLSTRVVSTLSLRSDEFGELSRAFNQMADRIETLVCRYKSFLAHASHEIGSPLTRLNIALALAQRNGGPEMRQDIDRIRVESDSLNKLVRELLLLARLESNNESSKRPVQVAINAMLEEICASAAIEAQELGKCIVFVRQEPFTVVGNVDLLRSAFDNVLRNSLRFARAGGSVQLSFYRNPLTSVGYILIDDDGAGIPAGTERQIFEPFVRLYNQIPGSEDGSGLGLAIARQAVLSNGGQISARNLDGGGLRITIELPSE